MTMLLRALAVVLLIVSLGAAWLWSDFRGFEETAMLLPTEGIRYELPVGGSVTSLARDLAQRGVLRRPLYLRLLASLQGVARQLKAGEYLIPAGTTPKRMLELLSSGAVIQYPLTLVEGWNFKQVLDQLRSNDWVVHTLGGLEPADIMARLERPGSHPEGRFLPDTYHFPRGAKDLEVLRRAMQAMDRVLADEWAKRDPELPLKDPYDALILASIIERETGLGSERPQIAGVFVRRLRKGMLLQTDPTVIYGLGDAFDGNLRRADLKQDTPYNTYTRSGLPPTPIAMPAREAIHAALHPADGKSLYFVAKGDGSHQFSATLKAHNRAVRTYQLKR